MTNFLVTHVLQQVALISVDAGSFKFLNRELSESMVEQVILNELLL